MELKRLRNRTTGTSTSVILEVITQRGGSDDSQAEFELDESATLTSICYSDLPAQDRKRADFLNRFEGLKHQTLHRVVATVSAMSGWYDFSKLEQIDGASGGRKHIDDSRNEPSKGWIEYERPYEFQ